MHYSGPRRKRERDRGVKNVFDEIIAENLPNLRKETDNQVQEAQSSPHQMNPKRPTLGVVKMTKTEEPAVTGADGGQEPQHKQSDVGAEREPALCSGKSGNSSKMGHVS